MKSKTLLILFIFLGLSLKSQEYKIYDFEKQVRHVFNDSSYVAMEVAVTEYLYFRTLLYNVYRKRNSSIKIYEVQKG